MKEILTASCMQQCDKTTIEYFGVPSLVLMERAALGMYEELIKRIDKNAQCAIVCGNGNNGGDGIALARLLHLAGYAVKIVFVGNPNHMSQDCKKQLDIAAKYKVPCKYDIEGDVRETLEHQDVIADAIFGVGLSREIQGNYQSVIRQMNEASGYKVALDIASGINADNGQIMGIAFRADLTITVAFEKIGQHLFPGADYTGELICREIGIDKNSFLNHKPSAYVLEQKDLHEIPERSSGSNKGTYGKVLVIAGKKNMAGAAYFSALAAYRTGCGLVKVFTEESNRQIIQTLVPEAVLETYREEKFRIEALKEALLWANVIICGPGLGTETVAGLIMEEVLKEKKKPVIIDADGLNVLSAMDDYSLGKNFILTPHLGEMSRLVGASISEIKKDLIMAARQYANSCGCNLVLKDAHSVIANSNGEIYLTISGNSGMSTGGSGDVLTGIIGGLCALKMPTDKACAFGSYLHGLCGTAAAKEKNEYSLIASDLIEGLGTVLKSQGLVSVFKEC